MKNINSSEINDRVDNIPSDRLLTVDTTLEHFSIITYTVDLEKLRRIIPKQFDIYTITLEGIQYGLVSAVTFIDKDFRFKKLLPFLKLSFPQTNYRAYIIDKESGEKCAWFFGTALGSKLVFIPKLLWKMPWFLARYNSRFELKNNSYKKYKIEISAKNANATIDISNDNLSEFNSKGFDSIEEAELILTHPVSGYFLRSDNKLGKYKIWHPKMKSSNGESITTYFQKFESLCLLNATQMSQPYSILLTDQIEFIIDLPPKKITTIN